MKHRSPRLAVRALIVQDARLLLVNAYPAHVGSDLWCAPGGGVERGESLPHNLIREVLEETGLKINVGPLVLVNEFHNPDDAFHQVDLFFRCSVTGGQIDPVWIDPEGVVTSRRFFSHQELDSVRYKPDSLREVAFATDGSTRYDPLETMVR